MTTRALWQICEPADAAKLASLAGEWPDHAPRFRYLAKLLEMGPRAMVEGVDLARLVLLRPGTPLAIPVVVNDGREQRCYFLSPHVHYVEYMQLELAKMVGSAPARFMSRAVGLLGKVGRPLGFNRCVSVNNWLLTTNPLVTLEQEELRSMVDTLTARFPELPIVLRSVDARAASASLPLTRAGFRLVVNRPVFEWSPSGWAGWPGHVRKRVRQDLRLVDALGWEPDAELRSGEEDRIAHLYRALYLEKHSGHNARYTASFFRAVADSGLMRFALLRLRDEITAFVGYVVEPTRIVAALVGYDLGLDRREYPLYRTSVAVMIRIAMERDRTLFLSTGAASFKKYRGATEWLEHEAVYTRHLPRTKQLPWWAMGTLLDRTVASLDTGKM